MIPYGRHTVFFKLALPNWKKCLEFIYLEIYVSISDLVCRERGKIGGMAGRNKDKTENSIGHGNNSTPEPWWDST